MLPALPKGTRFEVAKDSHKYVAHLPNGKKVKFGHKNYQHYKDVVPKSMGGGKWTRKNHLDPQRRANYRKRHGGLRCKNGTQCISVKYSPAWFSYYFLW